MTAHPTYFELAFRPNIELVSLVRHFVSAFYQRILGEDDTIFRLALATHELLENCVRYAQDNESRIRVEVHSGTDPLTIRLLTENRAHPEQAKELIRKLDAIKAAEDPFAHYQQQMLISQKRTDGGSGLGLARVYCEAEMTVDYELNGDLLRIVAETTWEPEGVK